MPASLLDSQLATLELPTPDEQVLVLMKDEGGTGGGGRDRDVSGPVTTR